MEEHMERIIYGTMGLGGPWDDTEITSQSIEEAEHAIEAALNIGIKTFDHADIYRKGKAEIVFAHAIKNLSIKREDIIIQSKSGIDLSSETTTYNFDPDYIERQLNQSLKNLQTDYLDAYLLHRPDPLADLSALGKRLKQLKNEGLFKKLGVSNMSHHQIELMAYYMDEKIEINQLEMSLSKIDFVDSTITFNHQNHHRNDNSSGTIEHCMKNNIELQAWGSLVQGAYSKSTTDACDSFLATRNVVKELSIKYKTSDASIVLAWLMKHPANIRPIVGSKNPKRILEIKDAESINLDHLDWYRLLTASRGQLIP